MLRLTLQGEERLTTKLKAAVAEMVMLVRKILLMKKMMRLLSKVKTPQMRKRTINIFFSWLVVAMVGYLLQVTYTCLHNITNSSIDKPQSKPSQANPKAITLG